MQDRESSPVKDRRSATVPRNQHDRLHYKACLQNHFLICSITAYSIAADKYDVDFRDMDNPQRHLEVKKSWDKVEISYIQSLYIKWQNCDLCSF